MVFVRGIIRAEKARMGLSWNDLSAELAHLGIAQSATNLSTKVARGTMSAPVFVALLKVLQVQSLDLQTLKLTKAAR
jgi:hypothetical protein